MSAKLNPYLTFAGNARAAMEFYQQVFGGELTMNTFGEFGGAPEGVSPDGVMHAMLVTDADLTLMGSDAATPGEIATGDAITISLSGDDNGALHGYWDQLSDGGTVGMPLEKQMWGDEFGMCTDRFGIPWMVNIAAPQS